MSDPEDFKLKDYKTAKPVPVSTKSVKVESSTNTTRIVQSLHVGTKKAFGSWKLIWMDADNNTRMADIPEKTARALIADGMPHEGHNG